MELITVSTENTLGYIKIQIGIFAEDLKNTPFELFKRVAGGFETIKLFSGIGKDLEEKTYCDYLCLPGEVYEYGLAMTGMEPSKWTTIKLPLEESIILSDNERTLYIKYNPKISSFKSTILEQKIDTIGSKYPFFFRNGNVNYKEMPIAGLVSYQADEFGAFDERFAAAALNGLANRPDDYYLERIFKREVEEWLTNGQPKLLRTLTEGAFIVRLMNVSFSPEDRLGRRIHSFQATAYEIAEANEANLDKYSLKRV